MLNRVFHDIVTLVVVINPIALIAVAGYEGIARRRHIATRMVLEEVCPTAGSNGLLRGNVAVFLWRCRSFWHQSRQMCC